MRRESDSGLAWPSPCALTANTRNMYSYGESRVYKLTDAVVTGADTSATVSHRPPACIAHQLHSSQPASLPAVYMDTVMKNLHLIPTSSTFSHPIPAEYFFSTPNPVYAVAICLSSGLPAKGTFGITGELILRIRFPFCHLTNDIKAQTN